VPEQDYSSNSKDMGFSKPVLYCVITATLYLAKPAAFVPVSPVDSSFVDKRVSWITLYFVNNTLRELSLDAQRESENPG